MTSPRTIRLLVVEDNDAYLYLLQRAFSTPTEKTLWELTIARDGKEALDLLFEEESERAPLPDLVLLDWKLPVVNGDEVLRRMKEHEKLRKIPVLVFSSSEARRISRSRSAAGEGAPSLGEGFPWNICAAGWGRFSGTMTGRWSTGPD